MYTYFLKKLSVPAAIVVLLLAAGCKAASGDSNLPGDAVEAGAETVYLFSSFAGERDGLLLAWSEDLYKWTKIPGPHLAPEIGDKVMRDPFISRGPDGTFHMVWTTGWHRRDIGYASTKDLLHWSRQRLLPVMAGKPKAKNCWAPKIFYDETAKQWQIVWSTWVDDGSFPPPDLPHTSKQHRIWYATTKDFAEVTEPKLLLDPGYSCIDAYLLKGPDQWLLFFKDERYNDSEVFTPQHQNIRVARSNSRYGPFGSISEPITGGGPGKWHNEGPCALKVGGQYYVFYDHHSGDTYFGATKSSDLVSWVDASKQMSFPKGFKHGHIIRAPRHVVANLIQAVSERSQPTAWWRFDEDKDGAAIDTAGSVADEIRGNYQYLPGVKGKALQFDGYTTCVVRKAQNAPALADAFTIQAWIAPQTYPWNWTAIVSQHEKLSGEKSQQPQHSREYLFFGLDATGHLGAKLSINDRVYECISREQLPLLKWSHVAAAFKQGKELIIYINGEKAGAVVIEENLAAEALSDIWIGKNHTRHYPVGTERQPSRKLLSNMVFDGLIDELKIHTSALSAATIAHSFASTRPQDPQPLQFRAMPSGPKDLPKRFCAYYTRLQYDKTWEKLWRVGDHPDILVTFDSSPVRVVFWRGTSFGASWVTENGIWMGDQSLEDGGTGWGCCEHMSDKQCRYSHVRLLENNQARVVVHWRYAVCDIRYTINHENPVTGWGDWADEYYYIYPDAVATRKQVLWTTSDVGGFQWQETIILNQPGTRPEDNVETEAFTLADLQGRTHTYSWADGAPKSYPQPQGANIQLTNLKAKQRPFVIYEPGRRIKPFGGGHELSKFPWWNHWPVAQLPNDGREVCGPDRPSSSSLSNRRPLPERGEGDSYIAVSLYGMTDKPIADIVRLARSWNRPADLTLTSAGFESQGYDRHQRAYVLGCLDKENPSTLRFELTADESSPVVNPAFVVKGWGTAGARVTINGCEQKPGRPVRLGHLNRLQTTDLVVWLRKQASEPVTISVSPTTD